MLATGSVTIYLNVASVDSAVYESIYANALNISLPKHDFGVAFTTTKRLCPKHPGSEISNVFLCCMVFVSYFE